MVKKGYNLTRKETGDLFLLLSHAKIKLNGKFKTLAKKYHGLFEIALDLRIKDGR